LTQKVDTTRGRPVIRNSERRATAIIMPRRYKQQITLGNSP
jgi:hypothetical protein